MDKNILRDISYGVYLISSKKNEMDVGCIANSVMQITSQPATVAISINRDNYTNGAIKETNEFICSILPQDVDNDVIGIFGFQSSKDINKFSKISYFEKNDYKIINNAIGYIRCKVINIVEMETHTIFIGEVIQCEKLNNSEPMTYAYYQQIKKGKSPKNAPTYIEEVENYQTVTKSYKCSICGYIHEGELEDDFKCPICGVGKEMFKEVS